MSRPDTTSQSSTPKRNTVRSDKPRPVFSDLIDSHCHLDYEPMANDVSAALKRCADVGVKQVVHIGCRPQNFESANKLAAEHENVFVVLGVHPHDAIDTNDEVLEVLRTASQSPKLVAIGETGLDYFYNHSPPDAQRQSFAQHIELAREVDLPLVLHIRDAHEDAWDIVKTTPPRDNPGVVHCFTGNAAHAKGWLDRGWHLSFSGIATFRKSEELREAARICPSDRILLETDAPFLAPEPVRGRKNEPANVTFTCVRLAKERGESPEELASFATTNTRRLFRMPQPT